MPTSMKCSPANTFPGLRAVIFTEAFNFLAQHIHIMVLARSVFLAAEEVFTAVGIVVIE